MHIDEEFHFLAEQLSQILGLGKVIDIQESSMDAYEKGFSGAEIFRMECLFENGKRIALSIKKQITGKEW